jgi:inner membrane protein
MPSPVGHALGGLAAGWLLQPRLPQVRPLASAENLLFLTVAIAPDLDLLVGVHRGATHSLGATGAVGIGVWALRRGPGRGRFAAATSAAYGSHVLLDWLGVDTSPPFGVPALWPFDAAYLQAPWQPFLAVSRRLHEPGLFWEPNALAIGREILLLLPLLILAGLWRRRLGVLHRPPQM